MNHLNGYPNGLAKTSRHGPRQHTNDGSQQPNRKVFKFVAEFWQLATVTSQEEYFKPV
jgi:hypothetical protein